jgi:hypothetical protein
MRVDPSGNISFLSVLNTIGVQASLIGISVPTITGVLTARTGGSFWGGFWAGIPAGVAMSMVVVNSKGVTTPAFAKEAAIIAYVTTWGVALDGLRYFSKRNLVFGEAEIRDSVIDNFTNAAIARAWKGWKDNRVNEDNPWVAGAIAAAAKFVQEGPALLDSVRENIGLWWSDRPTNWNETNNMFGHAVVDSVLAGIQTSLLSSNMDLGFHEGSVFTKETFKQVAFAGWKNIVKYAWGEKEQ